MFRRRTHWTALVTALRQVTEADIIEELLATRILQSHARERGNVRDDENFGTRVDELLEQLVTLKRG